MRAIVSKFNWLKNEHLNDNLEVQSYNVEFDTYHDLVNSEGEVLDTIYSLRIPQQLKGGWILVALVPSVKQGKVSCD